MRSRNKPGDLGHNTMHQVNTYFGIIIMASTTYPGRRGGSLC